MANSTEYRTVFTAKDDMSATIKNVKDELNSVGKSATTASDKINRQFERIVNSSAPLKRQLRDLQKLMTEMNYNGQANSEEFIKVAQAAGRIKDALSDTQDAIKRFSSDTMNIEAATQAVQGLAAAGSVASGVMGLFGTKNEEVQRAILKVQSAMAILNGVQSISNILNKDSVLMLKLKSIQENIAAAATTKETVATTSNTVATNVNTAAQKGWNVAKAIGKAMFGDFTGLLLLGAGAMLTYAMSTDSSTSAQDSLNTSIEKGTSFIDKQANANKEATKEIDNEKNKIIALKAILDDTNVSYENKVKALKQLQGIIPSVNGMIDSEGVYHGNAASAIREHIKALTDLQTALALFKMGQSIQDELTQARWQKFQADQQVSAKEGNVAASERQIAKSTGIVQEESAKNIGHRDTKRQIQASQDLRIANDQLNENKENLEIAQDNQKQADAVLKTAEKQAEQFNQFAKAQGVDANAMAAVTMAGGDAKKATDIYIGRDNIEKGGGGKGGRTGKGRGGSTTTKQETEAEKYAREKAQLEENYNNKLLTEIDYRKQLTNLEKSHLDALLKSGKATQADVDRYNNALKDLSKTEIQIKFDTDVSELEQKLKDGLIDDAQYAEAFKNVMQRIYEENLRNGTVTAEMAKNYRDAAQAAEKIKKAAELESNFNSINLDTKKKQSSYDIATGVKDTSNTSLDGLKEQMLANDALIDQLQKLKTAYEEAGLAGSAAYERVTSALNNVIANNQGLGDQAKTLNDQVNALKKSEEKAQGYSELVNNIGTAFGNLGGAMEGSAQQFMQFTAQAMQGISEMIPIIRQLIVAKNAEALASGTAEGAKMPFPYNIAAIASIIATIAGIFASIPKFEHGGLVGGNSFTGDKILARLNSGERVFTKKQSDNLTSLLENGIGMVGTPQTITWRIKGSDLYGTMRNYGKEQAKIGKNIWG